MSCISSRHRSVVFIIAWTSAPEPASPQRNLQRQDSSSESRKRTATIFLYGFFSLGIIRIFNSPENFDVRPTKSRHMVRRTYPETAINLRPQLADAGAPCAVVFRRRCRQKIGTIRANHIFRHRTPKSLRSLAECGLLV